MISFGLSWSTCMFSSQPENSVCADWRAARVPDVLTLSENCWDKPIQLVWKTWYVMERPFCMNPTIVVQEVSTRDICEYIDDPGDSGSRSVLLLEGISYSWDLPSSKQCWLPLVTSCKSRRNSVDNNIIPVQRWMIESARDISYCDTREGNRITCSMTIQILLTSFGTLLHLSSNHILQCLCVQAKGPSRHNHISFRYSDIRTANGGGESGKSWRFCDTWQTFNFAFSPLTKLATRRGRRRLNMFNTTGCQECSGYL